jgi:hypothetical protein
MVLELVYVYRQKGGRAQIIAWELGRISNSPENKIDKMKPYVDWRCLYSLRFRATF